MCGATVIIFICSDRLCWRHMSATSPQIFGNSTVCSQLVQGNNSEYIYITAPHYWSFVLRIHQRSMDSSGKGPIMRKEYPRHYIIMIYPLTALVHVYLILVFLSPTCDPWWGHQMVTGEFPAQRSVTRSFHVFINLRLNKRFSKQSRPRLFKTPSRSLWRHCNAARDWMQSKYWSKYTLNSNRRI